MKIKVDKEEYERLLEKVDNLEEKINRAHECMFNNWSWARESLYKMMEDYFRTQCMSVIIKRDKKKIIAELRKQAMDNLFKEEK